MVPGDEESWHAEWMRVADRNATRGAAEAEVGHIVTARNCWLRASEYYRQAEFWLSPDDERRLATFEKMEACTQRVLRYLNPPGEVVEVPYEDGVTLRSYFVPSPDRSGKKPVLIGMGGLDSIKDELWFMQATGALKRGISVLLIDGPGQGGALRRDKVHARHDYEVPIGRCIDYLATRSDVDMDRIAVCGSSLGGYYAARAASFESRLAACISHGAIWVDEEPYPFPPGLEMHLKWVFNAPSMDAMQDEFAKLRLTGVLDHMRCPYLILHGGHDVLGVSAAGKVYEYAKAHGVDVTLRLTSADETGADHCQHDHPTLGMEIMMDWLADKFGVDQRELAGATTTCP